MTKTAGRLFCGIVFLAGCSGAAALPGCGGGRAALPTAGEAGASAAGGVDLNALRRGRAVFVTECAACHRLYRPHEYSPEQWRGIIRRMAPRASLSAGQAADLELYMLTASRTGKE